MQTQPLLLDGLMHCAKCSGSMWTSPPAATRRTRPRRNCRSPRRPNQDAGGAQGKLTHVVATRMTRQPDSTSGRFEEDYRERMNK